LKTSRGVFQTHQPSSLQPVYFQRLREQRLHCFDKEQIEYAAALATALPPDDKNYRRRIIACFAIVAIKSSAKQKKVE
jgi:hypothetical protein